MSLQRIISLPGVKRDGTDLDGNYYSDATWCRFQRGLPRKIGGYRAANNSLTGISRALFTQSKDGNQYFHSGHGNGVEQFLLTPTGAGSLVADRTPAGYVGSDTRSWQFDGQYDNTSSKSVLVAHSGNNVLNPSDTTNYPIYSGDMYASSALVVNTLNANLPAGGVSGGIVSLAPYMIAYGSDGFWANSVSGKPLDFTNTGSQATQITHQKIIKGLPLRGGGGYSPAGLFWSIDSVIRSNFTGGSTVFQHDQLTTQSSIISDRSVIENDGIYYWCGVDRWLMYNGVIQEIPNNLNLNWFFDGLNREHAGKVFATKVPRYGEIWWCYPRGNATECSHAVIYNYREKTWYDTPLPSSGRSAAAQAENVIGGVMTSWVPNLSSAYDFWQHETGTDELNGSVVNAINSNFTTATMTMLSSEQPSGEGLSIGPMLPDFVQTGDMTVKALKWNNPKDGPYEGGTYTIYANPANAYQQITPMKETAKILQLQFESNVQGGDYQMGQTMAYIEKDGNKDL